MLEKNKSKATRFLNKKKDKDKLIEEDYKSKKYKKPKYKKNLFIVHEQ